ncbi:MAG: T9SS type A sorting domain-containing protein [Chitinophagaceae bacterium]
MKYIFIIVFLTIISKHAIAQVDNSFYAVRLSSFDASVNNKTITLRWNTVCFLQFANFQIQKSVNGVDYLTISSFIVDKLRCQQPFDFIDTANLASGDIYYRINVGDIDGKFYNSLVKRLYVKEQGFGLLKVYPTVVNSFINFTLSNGQTESFAAVIINQSGSILRQQKLAANRGISNYNFQANNLPAGLYFLQVINAKRELATAKFIKQ